MPDEIKIREIQAKSILRKHKKIDSWFVARYGMNLYRGCLHNCAYCDGRAERYQVEGEFGREIAVKLNSPDILRRELDPRRKRKPMKRGYILMGGGVGDGYQLLEKEYRLTRKALELAHEFNFPVHVLTKSTTVLQDLNILKLINAANRVVVSFSFSSVDDAVSAIFEPGVPAPNKRLEAISRLKDEGLACGMYLLPVIPFVTDGQEFIEEAVSKAVSAGVDFIVFGGMTLKTGRQREYFTTVLKDFNTLLLPKYRRIYQDDRWGMADSGYYAGIYRVFNTIADSYRIPKRMPLELFQGYVEENDRVVVMLEHMDYFLKSQNQKSPYGYAAYILSGVTEPLSLYKGKLTDLKGVGTVTERIVREILETGTSAYYEKLRRPWRKPGGNPGRETGQGR